MKDIRPQKVPGVSDFGFYFEEEGIYDVILLGYVLEYLILDFILKKREKELCF